MNEWLDGPTGGQMDMFPGHELRSISFHREKLYYLLSARRHGTQTLKEGLWGLINKAEVITLASP